MTAAIGQRFATGSSSVYIKHPTGGWSQDGDPLDCGQIEIFANNVHHLQQESVRQIGLQSFRTGAINAGDAADDYATLVDTALPNTRTPAYFEISWSVNNALELPFFGFADEQVGSDGNLSLRLRLIKVNVCAKSGASNSLKVCAVLTPLGITPLQADEILAESDSANIWTTVGTSTETKTLTLSPIVGIASNILRRQFRSNSGEYSMVIPLSVWVGFNCSNSGDTVYGVSAFEYRED